MFELAAGYLIGAALGSQRFSIWSLMPVYIATSFGMAIGYCLGSHASTMLMQFTALSIALQIGFVSGSAFDGFLQRRSVRALRSSSQVTPV